MGGCLVMRKGQKILSILFVGLMVGYVRLVVVILFFKIIKVQQLGAEKNSHHARPWRP